MRLAKKYFHLKSNAVYNSSAKNDESVDFNEGYGFWWFSWVMAMSESSLSRPMILSTHVKWVSIYFDLFKFYVKIIFFS